MYLHAHWALFLLLVWKSTSCRKCKKTHFHYFCLQIHRLQITDYLITIRNSPSCFYYQDRTLQINYSCNLPLAQKISLIKSINWLSMITQLESNHEWRQHIYCTEMAQQQDKSGMYSFCAAPVKRSGSEHDLTGWLDNIPTSPGVCLPLKQLHKTQIQQSAIQWLQNQHLIPVHFKKAFTWWYTSNHFKTYQL